MISKDTLSEIRGIPVITADEGMNLGVVNHIYLDPASRKLAAVSFKNRKTGKDCYVETKDITLVGQDVILAGSAEVAKTLDDEKELGRRFRKLRGMSVTTVAGKNLGKLDDFDLDHETRLLSQFHLDEGRLLPVDPKQVTIGPDAIIVPADYAEKVKGAEGKKGFLQRVRSWTDRGTKQVDTTHRHHH